MSRAQLALKHHPDRGGRAEDFVKFQAAFEEAREILRRR
jgi:curved DNA-binding protein CbpA